MVQMLSAYGYVRKILEEIFAFGRNFGSSCIALSNTTKYDSVSAWKFSDFIWEEHSLPIEELNLIDRWALSKTAELVHELTAAMESYELHRAVQLINRFCTEFFPPLIMMSSRIDFTPYIPMILREGQRKLPYIKFLRLLLSL